MDRVVFGRLRWIIEKPHLSPIRASGNIYAAFIYLFFIIIF